MKMSASTSGSEGLTPQLQAELSDFEEVLREYKVDLNPSKYISLTSGEYEDTMQVLDEFLKIQEGFGLEPENNLPMEQLGNRQPFEQPVERLDSVQPMEVDDVVINFDNRAPAPGYSTAEMGDLYLANVDIEMEFMELNLEPAYNMDLNEIDLDDLFFKVVDESSPPNDKPVLVAERPHSSDVQVEPGYIDGNEHQYGRPPVLTAQVTPNDLQDKEEISVDKMYNHIPTDGIPTDNEEIPADTDDIPTDTDDISTEPEDYSTDNEDTLTNPKNISTDPFATLSLDDQDSFWKPLPYTINTWMMNREKDRKEKLKCKAKKTVTTSPCTIVKPSGTTSHPRRRLFCENRKETSPSIPKSVSQSQMQTRTKEKTSLYEAADKKKEKKTNQTRVVKQEQNSGIPRRRCSREHSRRC